MFLYPWRSVSLDSHLNNITVDKEVPLWAGAALIAVHNQITTLQEAGGWQLGARTHLASSFNSASLQRAQRNLLSRFVLQILPHTLTQTHYTSWSVWAVSPSFFRWRARKHNVTQVPPVPVTLLILSRSIVYHKQQQLGPQSGSTRGTWAPRRFLQLAIVNKTCVKLLVGLGRAVLWRNGKWPKTHSDKNKYNWNCKVTIFSWSWWFPIRLILFYLTSVSWSAPAPCGEATLLWTVVCSIKFWTQILMMQVFGTSPEYSTVL